MSIEKIINRDLFVFIIITIFIVLLRIPSYFIEFLNVDELSDYLLAREVVNGWNNLKDVMQVRFTSFFFYYFIIFLTNSETTITLHIANTFNLIIQAFFIFKISKIIINSNKAIIATLIFIFCTIISYPELISTKLEYICNLFIIVSIYLILYTENMEIQNRLKNKFLQFFAGILIFLAGLAKQPALLIITVPIMFYLFMILTRKSKSKDYFLKIFFILSGYVFSIIVLIVILYSISLLNTWLYFYFYTSFSFYVPYSQDYSYFATILRFLETMGLIILNQPILWLGTGISIIFLIYKRFIINFVKTKYLIFIVIWLCVSYSLFFLGGQNLFLHYLIYSFPVGAILSSILIIYLIQRYKNKLLKIIILLGLCIPVLCFSMFYISLIINESETTNYVQYHKDYIKPRERNYKTIEYLKENRNLKDKIFVWGDDVSIYYLSGMKIGTPYLWCKYIAYTNNYHRYIDKKQFYLNKEMDLLIEKLKENKPRFIIDCSTSRYYNFKHGNMRLIPNLRNYIKRNYVKVFNKDYFDGITVYIFNPSKISD